MVSRSVVLIGFRKDDRKKVIFGELHISVPQYRSKLQWSLVRQNLHQLHCKSSSLCKLAASHRLRSFLAASKDIAKALILPITTCPVPRCYSRPQATCHEQSKSFPRVSVFTSKA